MEARELKGLQIAAVCKLSKKEGVWQVPSQTGNGTYEVNPQKGYCSCPDHEVRQVKCKHLFAVEFTVKREYNGNGTVTETVKETVTETTEVQTTYPQNWTAYNAAQCEEKTRFVSLLHDLCQNVQQPAQTMGRPRLPLSEMLFSCAYKVYSGFSSRRFTCDLQEAQSNGLITRAPHFNSVSHYMDDPSLTQTLRDLVTLSSLPLKSVESQFAIDSSGFSTSRFIKWFNKKYGRDTDNREWVKVHLVCGTLTHIVTAVDISGWQANDTLYYKPLLASTAQHFAVAEISADKGYLSHSNVDMAASIGAAPFIPFKVNTFPVKDGSNWSKMYAYFMYRREEFLTHYHRRSNVETVFSMVKAKFGDALRSKSDTGQVNEVLCKVLCHNLCVLVQSIHELGIEPVFQGVAVKAVA